MWEKKKEKKIEREKLFLGMNKIPKTETEIDPKKENWTKPRTDKIVEEILDSYTRRTETK